MANNNENLIQLESVAASLGDLLPDVTFVGGSTTILLVDKAAHFGVRKTNDVDVIVDIATLVEYHQFSEKLRSLGFKEDADGPICRWFVDTTIGQMTLDVMPTDEKILGFSNRWYGEAIKEASTITLPNGLDIRVITPAYFIATKFEAFAGRGKGNYFSHDLEDIVFVMENRGGLLNELMESPGDMKAYFAKQASLLLNDDFLNVLPGLLNNPASAGDIENALNIMKAWA